MAHVKTLGMRMRKLELGLSLGQILPEKIYKMISPNNLGFIDVNQTVVRQKGGKFKRRMF